MENFKAVVVLGKFDGVHIAHTKLITTAVDIASKRGARSLVYSMQKSDTPQMTDKNQKINIIKSLGVDEVIFKELDEAFMNLSGEEFVNSVIKDELGAVCVVVGENFRFGKDRSAGASELKELCALWGIDVVVMETVQLGDETVSSTYVKTLLKKGEVSLAKEYLGRPFVISGTVCPGKHLGRALGFPTANIYPQTSTVVPKNGVYATYVICDGVRYPSITNVGVNPTVEDGKNIKVETHIFAGTDDWYGKEITVEFCEFIRSEIQFENPQELAKQVEEDKGKAKKYHGIK